MYEQKASYAATLLLRLWILIACLATVSCEDEEDYCIITNTTVWDESTETYVTIQESYCEYY